MSETTATLRRQMETATDLQAVVRTMKALAASSIGQYERSARALAEYNRTVELALGACLRGRRSAPPRRKGRTSRISAIVFGSDQGLVGQFNEDVAQLALTALAALPTTADVWAVGERVHARLEQAGVTPVGLFPVPTSVHAIAELGDRILVESEGRRGHDDGDALHLFFNRPSDSGGYAPAHLRLLPLDEAWRARLVATPWPTRIPPEVIGGAGTLRALVREHVFVTLFRACAESLASENASRLSAMQRADKNITDLLDTFGSRFHRLRQMGIDEELFDVVAGFDALAGSADGRR